MKRRAWDLLALVINITVMADNPYLSILFIVPYHLETMKNDFRADIISLLLVKTPHKPAPHHYHCNIPKKI